MSASERAGVIERLSGSARPAELGLIALRVVAVVVVIVGVPHWPDPTAHRFSESAREKIEAAGGSVVVLREPVETTSKKARKRAAARGGPPPGADLEPETDETPAEEAEAADDAPDADAEAPSDEETTD